MPIFSVRGYETFKLLGRLNIMVSEVVQKEMDTLLDMRESLDDF